MNKLVIVCAIVAAVAAAGGDEQAQVLRQDSDVHAEGYSYSYETSNGISGQEQGSLQGDAIAAQGSFEYTADDGSKIQLTYVADENGFQPQGAHLPTPPPVPDHVLKALEYIRTHAPKTTKF